MSRNPAAAIQASLPEPGTIRQGGPEGLDLTPLLAALAELFPDVTRGPQPDCRGCGAPEIRAKHLCASCYFRWAAAGRPDVVPPRRRRPRRTTSRRFEDFRGVRALGASVQQAAKHTGIPEYVGWRFDAQLRNVTQTPAPDRAAKPGNAGRAPTGPARGYTRLHIAERLRPSTAHPHTGSVHMIQPNRPKPLRLVGATHSPVDELLAASLSVKLV